MENFQAEKVRGVAAILFFRAQLNNSRNLITHSRPQSLVASKQKSNSGKQQHNSGNLRSFAYPPWKISG
jgi:hypothetical protein